MKETEQGIPHPDGRRRHRLHRDTTKAVMRYTLMDCQPARSRSAPSRPPTPPSRREAHAASAYHGSRRANEAGDSRYPRDRPGASSRAGVPGGGVGPRRRPPCAPSSTSCCPAATSTPTASCTSTGTMRLATARDELLPLYDGRVQERPEYLSVVLLGPGHHPARRRHGRADRSLGHRAPVRLRPGVPAGPLPAHQPGGAHPGRGAVPGLPARLHRRRGRWSPGGIVTYAVDRPPRGDRVRRVPLPLGPRRDHRSRAPAPDASWRRSPRSTIG